MNLQIALLLGQDGVTNGAIYALLALSIVLVFTVTRVLLVPQGEFVTFGAMSMGALQAGQPVQLAWLLMGLSVAVVLQRLWWARSGGASARRFTATDLLPPAYALTLFLIGRFWPAQGWPMACQVLYTLALIVPLGPWLYDLFFRPIAGAHGLVLLIVSIALHAVLVGVALLMFGAEGAHTLPFSEDGLELGLLRLNAQTLWVLVVTLALIVALALYFERTLQGKALRATAVSRLGAELMGISPSMAGRLCFGLPGALHPGTHRALGSLVV